MIKGIKYQKNYIFHFETIDIMKGVLNGFYVQTINNYF